MLDAAFGKKTQENICVRSSLIIRTTRLRISEVTALSHFSSIPLCCKSLWTQSRHITIALSGLHEEMQQKCDQRKWKYVESTHVDFKVRNMESWHILGRGMYNLDNTSKIVLQIIQEESKNGKTITYGAVHKENRKYSPLGKNIEDY